MFTKLSSSYDFYIFFCYIICRGLNFVLFLSLYFLSLLIVSITKCYITFQFSKFYYFFCRFLCFSGLHHFKRCFQFLFHFNIILGYVWFPKNWRKMWGKENKEKKYKEKKIGLNLINYFYMLLQTHFIISLYYIKIK